MKISYNWLKEYYSINDSPEKVAAMLTACGLEVESVEEFDAIKGGLRGLVVGKVLTCIKHPDADKLHVTTVDIGSGEPSQIVCGAPNIAAGQTVVVAVPGTKIFPVSGDPFSIKQAKIRGQVSNGMICAEDEIGLGVSHAGVIVLPDNLKAGSSVAEFYNVKSDHVFEIGLTPNRADAASHIGVARDLAAVVNTNTVIDENKILKSAVKWPEVKEIKPGNNRKEIKVEVQDKNACPRYSSVTMTNVKVGPSPAWLKDRLESIGVNSINNIVDITNFVLHECGQPLHAFDADKIGGQKIVVRSARQGEKFTTLDKVERTLSEGDLMICDAEKPLCIAGVFGGLNSGITEETTSVFIESACFNPASIRKTSKRHGLKTDASFRFERGTDPELTMFAMKRAAQLIHEIAGGEVASEASDIYPEKIVPARIDLSLKYLETFGGEKIPANIVRIILESLQIKIVNETPEKLTLEIPLFKVDVTRPADVVEEILRIYGYDRIPVPAKMNVSLPSVIVFDPEKLQNHIADYLSSNGFNETMSNSLTKIDYNSVPGWEDETLVKILNPLSSDLSVMRKDLLMNALENIQFNSNRRNSDLKFFEFGKTYERNENKYQETNHLSLIISGKQHDTSWKKKEEASDFYLLKAYVENILSLAGIEDKKTGEGTDERFRESLMLHAGNNVLVEFGSVNRKILKRFDINEEVLFAEINWDNVLKHARKKPVRFKEISKFPSVKRDLSMQLSSDVSYEKLETIAYNTERKLLRDIRLFDVYSGDKIESGKKSYALSFILQDDEETLTDSKINKVMDKLMAAFEREVGAVIRKS